MKRKIPTTMATQHPDHASVPFWHSEAFISTQYEAEEAFLSFSQLNIGEYKWDWEGKLVDESVLERLFSEHFEYFKKNPLGVEKFLTFRLPNPKVQTEFRISRALMNLASGASIARYFDLSAPPLFEVILPMTQTAQEMLDIQEAYQQIHQLKHPLYKLDNILTNLRIIPLFEEVSIIINSDKILELYLKLYKKRFKKQPPYMRPYVARSDPALNSGIVPTVLAIKIALSKYAKLAKKTGIDLYPIIGAASLPFRGGLTPATVEQFASEYKGIKTTTLQSAFRYDYNKNDVIAAIKKLDQVLPNQQAIDVSSKDEIDFLGLIPIFEKYYREVVEEIAPLVNTVAALLPKRRERVQHIGLFGYSRGVGKIKLPRAIGFTGALYSLGVPPEIIGTGRGLKKAHEMGLLDVIQKHYLYLKEDLERASHFLNAENLKKLSKNSKAWRSVQEDVKVLKELFNFQFKPASKREIKHNKLTSKILSRLRNSRNITELLSQAALERQSLG